MHVYVCVQNQFIQDRLEEVRRREQRAQRERERRRRMEVRAAREEVCNSIKDCY
jgi:hypothetical protein